MSNLNIKIYNLTHHKIDYKAHVIYNDDKKTSHVRVIREEGVII
jgi:hypothetical protein